MKCRLMAMGWIFISACTSPKSSDFTFREGDILFQDIDCGSFCESIEQVTIGYRGAKISHCGIVVQHADSLLVLEAGGRGVVMTPLEVFLARSLDSLRHPKVFVGRLQEEHWKHIPSFVASARKFIGRPYDSYFNLDNDSLYCSELVYLSYRAGENHLFAPKPMTFKMQGNAITFPEWQKYFDELGVSVPEGRDGLNPGGISLSDNLRIVQVLGKVDGLRDTY
jgi:hypothetical protein